MLEKLKSVLFPCEQRMKELRKTHAEATAENGLAHKRLMAACQGRACNVFPPLKEGHIVNPR